MAGITVNAEESIINQAIDAVLIDPLRLIISQPHQAFISTASVALVATEAGHMVAQPWNVIMAIGAEWAYLKGLSSRAKVQTPWNARLIAAATALVIVYGGLAGVRAFGVPLPGDGWKAETEGQIIGAVLLTLVHVLIIGAVTLCSGMIHRAAVDAERVEQARHEAEQRERERKAQEREERLQAERDAIQLEAERKEQEIRLWEQAQRVKAALKQSSTPRAAQDRPLCPSCGQQLDSQDFALFKSAQARQARFRGCKTCRAA